MPKIDQIDRRTDAIFILFHYADEIDGITKLQKLMFLIEKETEFFNQYKDALDIDFSAYKMGPFSEDIYDELEFMRELDSIQTEPINPHDDDYSEADLSNERFSLNERGEKIAAQLVEILEPKYRQELGELIRHYNDMSLSDLLEYVYTNYPEYTSESEIIEEVFG